MPVDRDTPLGATLLADGVAFRLWAPEAVQAWLLTGPALAAAGGPGFQPPAGAAMQPLGDGTWGAVASGIREGEPYRFWIAGRGSTGFKRDPRARELSTVPPYPSCNCIVRNPLTWPWHDEGFAAPEFRDLLLYQLHVGVYYGVDAAGNDKRRGVARFLDLLDRVDWLRDLGINAVQLMPIQEFSSPTSRGYNGLDLFSPEMDYHVADPAELRRYLDKANALFGNSQLTLEELTPGPNQLKCAIDLFHSRGIAVLFDLVFNHAGPGFNDESLWFLDRQPYGDDNRSLYCTDHEWVGGRVFAYWKDEVRQFLIDNARACLDEYHVDGVRYDEVSVMENNGGSRFCRDLTSTTRYLKPRAISIAEDWNADRAAAVRPPPSGLGFDAAWGDRLRDGVRRAVEQMAGGRDAFVDMDALAASFQRPFGEAWRVVNCLENHDLVFEGKERRIPKLAHADARSWYARSRSRAALGLLLAGQGMPMLFMGQEILEDKQWSDDVGGHSNLFIWWDGLRSDRAMQDYLRFCRDWLWMRRLQPALRGESLSALAAGGRVLRVHRWIEGAGQDVLFVANLQESNLAGFRIGFPGPGRWREIFNSDAYDDYPATGNGGSIDAEGVPWQEMPASALLTLPANGFLLFAR